MQKHREITARKFQTRIDYVDLSAFGVGVNFDDVDHFKEGSKKIEEEIQKYSSEYGRLNSKLLLVEKKLDYFMHQLSAMSSRYDERMQMIMDMD